MFYLTTDTLPIFIPLGFIGLYRWFWYSVRFLAYLLYTPIPPRIRPRYTSKDVTIIIPTIDTVPGIKHALECLLRNNPYQVIFVTIPEIRERLEAIIQTCKGNELVRVITIRKGNKRNQMVAGVNHTKTEILVFCDDDVLWGPNMLKWMLAPFQDKQMGAVGTSQMVIPITKDKFTIWEVLASYRISMRNIEIVSTTYIDGGVCCLSGRTAAYRTRILRDPDFQWQFTHEMWLGKYLLHSGDDKFLTRWMHSKHWKTYIQSHKEATLASYFKNDWTFTKQLLRWTRNTWRSDMKSLIWERTLWSRHPFTAFTMFDKFFNLFTLLAGPITVLRLCLADNQRLPVYIIILSFIVWLLVTRTLKYLPHIWNRPRDILWMPVWILFGYFFAIMKGYCLFTLHVTGWGTRRGADSKQEEEDLDIFTPHWEDGRHDHDRERAETAVHVPEKEYSRHGSDTNQKCPSNSSIEESFQERKWRKNSYGNISQETLQEAHHTSLDMSVLGDFLDSEDIELIDRNPNKGRFA